MSGLDQKIGQTPPNNADELTKLLEIELIQKRAEWQRASARNKNLKSLSFFFLSLVVLGALAAVYFTFMRVSEGKPHRPVPLEHGGH